MGASHIEFPPHIPFHPHINEQIKSGKGDAKSKSINQQEYEQSDQDPNQLLNYQI